MANDKEVALINLSASTFRTSRGSFAPKGEITLPADEAERLIALYPSVKKAGEYTPPKGQVEALTAQVKELQKKLDEATAGKGNEELEKKLKAADKRVQELEADNEKLAKELEKLKKAGK